MSYSAQICGWLRLAIARASRSKRWRRSARSDRVSRQNFDGHSSIQSGVSSLVDFSHSTSSQHALNLVRPKLPSDKRRRLGSELLGSELQGGPVDELLCLLVIRQQRFHFAAQVFVALAGFSDEGRPLCVREL